MIANDFAFDVEGFRGSEPAARVVNVKIQLVEAKLEMVRAHWLFQLVGIVRRLCLLSRVDRVQRDEVH